MNTSTQRDVLWSRLAQIHSLQFISSTESETGWEGVGRGVVKVSVPTDDTILFEESGIWKPSRERSSDIPFTNSYRWTRLESSIRLEHLRYGEEQPVFLFELIPNESGEWVDLSPHICSADCYKGTLTLDVTKLHLVWTIEGPRKKEKIAYTYW